MLHMLHITLFTSNYINFSRFQWPRSLRRESTPARLMGMRVRIPQVHSCFQVLSVVCCQVAVCASGSSLVQRSPTDCGASLCVIWKPQEWGHCCRWAAAPLEKEYIYTRKFKGYCLSLVNVYFNAAVVFIHLWYWVAWICPWLVETHCLINMANKH